MTPTGLCGSFRLDPKLLDDRPPSLGISLLQGFERLRRLSVARDNFQPEIGKTSAHTRNGQGLYDRTIEVADNIVRRAPGRPYHATQRRVGSPISLKVGTSGASTERVSLATA